MPEKECNPLDQYKRQRREKQDWILTYGGKASMYRAFLDKEIKGAERVTIGEAAKLENINNEISELTREIEGFRELGSSSGLKKAEELSKKQRKLEGIRASLGRSLDSMVRMQLLRKGIPESEIGSRMERLNRAFVDRSIVQSKAFFANLKLGEELLKKRPDPERVRRFGDEKKRFGSILEGIEEEIERILP